MWITSSEEETIAIWELATADDRTAAITAGSILEDRLTAAIQAKLHDDEEITREMFLETGPLGPFGTKIKMGFMLGLYGKQAYDDLKRISKIRNLFAHKLWAKTFDRNEIKTVVINLALVEKHVFEQTKDVTLLVDRTTWQKFFIKNKAEELADPKRRYLISVMIISTMLTPLVKQVPPPQLPAPLF